MTHLIEERMTGHVKDVHFDFSITNLHSDNTQQNAHIRKTHTYSYYYDDVLIKCHH